MGKGERGEGEGMWKMSKGGKRYRLVHFSYVFLLIYYFPQFIEVDFIFIKCNHRSLPR